MVPDFYNSNQIFIFKKNGYGELEIGAKNKFAIKPYHRVFVCF